MYISALKRERPGNREMQSGGGITGEKSRIILCGEEKETKWQSASPVISIAANSSVLNQSS